MAPSKSALDNFAQDMLYRPLRSCLTSAGQIDPPPRAVEGKIPPVRDRVKIYTERAIKKVQYAISTPRKNMISINKCNFNQHPV